MRGTAFLCFSCLASLLTLAAPAKAWTILPGNTTDLTVTSYSALVGAGISVAPTGSAMLDTSGTFPVAKFPITGGTAGPSGLVIDHNGSDLALSKAGDTVDIGDFVVSTITDQISGFVSLNGMVLYPSAVLFGLSAGPGKSFDVTLSAGAATALNSVFGTNFSDTTMIGTAVTNPIIAVPEASTWIMLCAGFGLVGAVAISRNRSVAAIG